MTLFVLCYITVNKIPCESKSQIFPKLIASSSVSKKRCWRAERKAQVFAATSKLTTSKKKKKV